MPLIAIPSPSDTGQLIPMAAVLSSAGFPSPAADELEDEIDPIAWVVHHPSSTCCEDRSPRYSASIVELPVMRG